jgi:hypothetical protein
MMRAKFPTNLATGVLAASAMLGTLTATPAEAAPAGHRPASHRAAAPAPSGVLAQSAGPKVRAEADRLMGLTYRKFARARHIPPFDWGTDGCSVPVGTPYSGVFRPACVQHDFGYRNYGARGKLKLAPTRKTKSWIDGRFRTEMQRICDDRFSAPRRNRECRDTAQVYYLGVQIGGDRYFF